jgi:branched-chain amino acid transport system permease protein
MSRTALGLRSRLLDSGVEGLSTIAVLIVLAPILLVWPWAVGTYALVVLGTVTLTYALIGEGLNFLYGTAGQLSVAQGGLMGIGAYVGALGLDRYGLSFWPALPLALTAGAVTALALGLVARRVRGHYFLIVTFAFAAVIAIVGDVAVGVTGGSLGLSITSVPPGIKLFGIDPLIGTYYLTLLFFFVGIGVAVYLQFSSFGRRLYAARHNPDLARALGMRLNRDRLLAFGISGAYAGVGGLLFAYAQQYVSPDTFDAWSGIEIILIVMLGGRRFVAGPLIGAAIVVLVPNALQFNPNINQMAFGILLIIVILFLPTGILGAGQNLAMRLLPASIKSRMVR